MQKMRKDLIRKFQDINQSWWPLGKDLIRKFQDINQSWWPLGWLEEWDYKETVYLLSTHVEIARDQ